MKKLISLTLILMLCMGLTAFADEAIIGGADVATDILVSDSISQGEIPIKIISDNKLVKTDTVVINERTLIPVRALLESTGAEVKWYEDGSQKIDVIRGGKTLTIQIGNTVMTTADGDKTLEVAPILHNGTTTYAPLRAIAEEFGIKVDWDNGTKTILVTTPDGNPYVDLYDGMTLSQYLSEVAGMTAEEYEQQTGLSYEEYKDTLFVIADNAVPLSSVASLNGLTVEEVRALFGLDESISDLATWGEVLGETALGTYVEVIMGASQFGMTQEQALESIKASYGLGDEYTLDTKFKYVRTIMHTMEAQYMAQQQAIQLEQEAKLAADLEALPALLKNKIKFTITLNDGSVMKGELYPDLAPITVENFVKLANDKFYDGLIFHRVIDGFMIQGGGYDKDYKEKEGAQAIKGEFYSNGVTNALKHEKGVISMARTDDPNSATSQFFIMDEAAPYLDGNYAAFGKITEGIDVVEKISLSKTEAKENGMTDAPVEAIVIKSITITK